METLDKNGLLREFRSAHRLINECQNHILELIFKRILPAFDLPQCDLEARHLFCQPVRKMDSIALGEKSFRISADNWAWDMLYTHVLEYSLGKKGKARYSLIQVSDTGSYLTDIKGSLKRTSTNFADVEQSASLLIFKIKIGDNMHTSEKRLREIIRNNQDLLIPADAPQTCYYRVNLASMMDEASVAATLASVKTVFDQFLKENKCQ